MNDERVGRPFERRGHRRPDEPSNAAAAAAGLCAAAANVTGSTGATPNKKPVSSRAATNASARPTPIPMSASFNPSLTTSVSTQRRCAPSAMRTPISCDRRLDSKLSTP